jgi:hypothetical protein
MTFNHFRKQFDFHRPSLTHTGHIGLANRTMPPRESAVLTPSELRDIIIAQLG